ncbi:MAG: hypothetical protein ABJO86_13615 [Lentilitoribacter sp.]
MKRFPIILLLGLAACASPVEISARKQIDDACIAGNLQACEAVERRAAAESQALATAFPSKL